MSMIEHHNALNSAPSVQRFLWLLRNYFPFPAVLYLTCALRYRPTGELAEKAWQLLGESDINREFKGSKDLKIKTSAIYYGISSLTIKAWEAREAALAHAQPPLVIPAFITDTRARLAKRKGQSPATQSSSSSTTMPMNDLSQKQFGGDFGLFDPNLGQDGQFNMFPTVSGFSDNSTDDWAFWNGIMQGNPGMPNMDPMMVDNWGQN